MRLDGNGFCRDIAHAYGMVLLKKFNGQTRDTTLQH
jgi:hypothetical protein